MMEKLLFINNQWQKAASGEVFEVFNPATGEVIATVACADSRDVDRAVAAAKDAFENGPWSSMSFEERGALITKIGDCIEERIPELARLETLDTGKPITESLYIDIPVCARTMRYFGGLAADIRGQTIPVSEGDFFDFTVYEPIGVGGIIVPWNYPLHLATRSLGAVLAAGNTTVVKPSSLAPLTTATLGEIIIEAGLPPGVVNIVHGPGSTVGAALADHPDVGLLVFTGSTSVGQSIMRSAAKNLKRISLELGGKSPIIFCQDVDVDRAAAAALYGFSINQGEVCCAGTRLFVHDSIYDEFLEKLVVKAERIRLGDTMDERTQMGALISPEQLARVDGYVQQGIEDGARLECGGKRPDDPVLRKGSYYCPTVLSNVTNDQCVAQEEIFGPVAVIIKFSDLDDAVAQANDTPYGLAAGVWTNDLKTGHKVARRLRAGTVWVNAPVMGFLRAPYGGYKMSGIGREYGIEGVKQCMELKNVIVDLRDTPWNWYEDQYGAAELWKIRDA